MYSNTKEGEIFMARLIGTVSRGVRAPIIKVGDDIASIVADSVIAAAKSENARLEKLLEEWIAWGDDPEEWDCLPTESGSYYLTGDVTVTVDLSDAQVGTFTQAATITLSSKFPDVGVMGTYSVSVTVKEADDKK